MSVYLFVLENNKYLLYLSPHFGALHFGKRQINVWKINHAGFMSLTACSYGRGEKRLQGTGIQG